MKKISLIILSVTSFSIKGADRDEMLKKAHDLEKKALSLMLGCTSTEMARMSDIKETDIQDFFNHDTPNSRSYSGLLADGETINADYFHAGPMIGEYYCFRTKQKLLIPLTPYKKYFDMLKAGYEAKSSK